MIEEVKVKYKNMLNKLTGEPTETERKAPRKLLDMGQILRGQQALRSGQLVFVSGETLKKLEGIIGRTPSKKFLRTLLEQIADGSLKLTTGAKPRTLQHATTNGHGDGGEVVYTLQQAARALGEGVSAQALYYRASTNRIRATRDGRRFLIGQSEIDRLKVVGI